MVSEADFPKDEATVPVSERACLRLVAALTAFGIAPAEPVNPLDAAAFILEGIVEVRDTVNSTSLKIAARSEPECDHEYVQPDEDAPPICWRCGEVEPEPPGGCMGDPDSEPGRVKNAVVQMMNSPAVLQENLEELERMGVLTGDGVVVDCPPHLRHQLGHCPADCEFCEPTDAELDQLDTEVHESGCAIWDNQEEVDGACTCGMEDE